MWHGLLEVTAHADYGAILLSYCTRWLFDPSVSSEACAAHLNAPSCNALAPQHEQAAEIVVLPRVQTLQVSGSATLLKYLPLVD